MKFKITVELMQGDVPVAPKDLKAFGTINFVKAAPKAFKRAMKATCWPFNANVTVDLVDDHSSPKKRKKKGKKNGEKI
jgi:hypothetical protein